MSSINHQAPVQCAKSIIIQADPQTVWNFLSDINHWASWQTDIQRPQLHGPLEAESTFEWKTGGAFIRSTLHTVNSPHQLGWTGRTLGLFAIHNWTLSPAATGTCVTVEESMEGWLAFLFKRAFQQNLEAGMQRWLDLLKKVCES